MTDTFKEHIINILETNNIPLADTQKQQEAIYFINNNEFPNKKQETWQKIDLAKLFKHKYEKPVQTDIETHQIDIYKIKNINANTIVFMNGNLLAESSFIFDKQIVIKKMSEAKKEHHDIFINYYNKTNILNENIFTAINTAFAEDGIFIHIPKNTIVENPIHVLFFTDGNNRKVFSQLRNTIIVDKNAQAKIIISFHSTSVNYTVTNVATEIFAEENSSLDYNIFQGEGDDAMQFNFTNVQQERYSNFTSNYVTLCGAIIRNDLKINLQAEHCQTQLNGFYLPDREQHFDNNVAVHHKMPNCVSNQLYRGIIDNKAMAIFSGKVLVDKDAQKTDAHQNNSNILLTQYAKAHSKPQLEIYADDVKCSHGATIGQLDKNALFYLQSRGIGAKEAKILLLNAFANQVLDKITISEFKMFVKLLIERRMSGDKNDGQCAMLEDCQAC